MRLNALRQALKQGRDGTAHASLSISRLPQGCVERRPAMSPDGLNLRRVLVEIIDVAIAPQVQAAMRVHGATSDLRENPTLQRKGRRPKPTPFHLDCMAAARERRASRTIGLRPFFVLKALTSTNAASGSSFCTGSAAYAGDTKVMEHPPKRHGSVHPAAAGVVSPIAAQTSPTASNRAAKNRK
jgi:hypothetical protein